MAEIVKKSALDNPKGSAAGRGVIESEVFDASRKARTIVLDAQTRAEQVVLSAEQEAARIRQAAHEQGLEEGKVQGLASYEAAIVQVNQQYDDILAQAEEQLLALSLGLAQKVIQRELVVNPKSIVEIVRKALQPMNRKKAITLRVNPADREILEKNRAELLEMMLSGGNVHLVGDVDITRGGCMVETEHGSVDARLETQLGVLSRIITGGEAAVFAPLPEEETMQEQVISFPVESFEPEESVQQENFTEANVPMPAVKPEESESLPAEEAIQEESVEVAPEIAEEAVLEEIPSNQFDETMVSERDLEPQEPVHFAEAVIAKFENAAQEVSEDLEIDDLLASLDKYLGEKE